MDQQDDDEDHTTGNILGLAITVVLICFSLLVLLRMEHFIARRDCYVQGIHACAAVGSGRYTHF